VTVELRQRRHVGLFGGLNDGAALPALERHELAVARNIEHLSDGAITKRPGRSVHATLCAAAEPLCEPVAVAVDQPGVPKPDAPGEYLVPPGELKQGEYWVRTTYSTGAGESDDFHGSTLAHPGPQETQVTVGPGENAIEVSAPFHLRKVLVASHEMYCQPDCPESDPQHPNCVPCENGANGALHRPEDGCETVPCKELPVFDVPLLPGECVTIFTITPPAVQVCDEDVFKGWLVYSRSPRIQDETHLGVNCCAEAPLYHRTIPLGTIREYDQATGRFVMNGAVEFGGEDCTDENTVDIMMPDRCGLPIRHFNVYVSRDAINFRYATSGVDGTETVFVTSYDDTAVLAPSTRIDRHAPELEVVTVKDEIPGKCGEHVVATGIDAGVYQVRHTWLTADPRYIEDPGFVTAARLLGIPEDQPPHRCRQETWPSCSAYACVDDGEGIRVTPPPIPDGVLSWQVYVQRVLPFGTLTMEGAQLGPDWDVADPGRPYAWYFPDQDLAANHGLVLARNADVATYPPLGSGSGVGDDSGASNSPAYEQFNTATNLDCTDEDPFDIQARGYRPAYEDVWDFIDDEGEHPFNFASSRDDAGINRMDFNFWMGQLQGSSAATHAIVRIRLRIREGRVVGFNPGLTNSTTIQFYDYSTGTFTVLGRDFPYDCLFHEYEFCVDDLQSRLRTENGESWFSVTIYARDSVGFDVDQAEVDLVAQPAVACEPVKVLLPGRGGRNSQSQGGNPEQFGAYYSGDVDLNDAAVEATISPASLDVTPRNARNQPDGYDEYFQATNNTGGFGAPVVHQFAVWVDIGAFAAPGASLPMLHDVSGWPCITYDGFSLRRKSDGFVYTNFVDYIFDYFTGFVLDLGIGAGVELQAFYALNQIVTGREPRLPIPANYRGWGPSFEDLCRPGTEILGCYGDFAFLFVSSRENVARNRHHWWFRCEDADIPAGAVPTKLVVQMTFRARSGGTGGEGAWSPAADTSRTIRVWDEGALAWVELETGIGSTTEPVTGGFVTKRWATNWAPTMRLTYTEGLDGPLESTNGLPNVRNYIIVDMKAWDYNGFDVADVCVELWPDQTDPAVTDRELLQVERLVDESYTLQNPLVEKPALKDGTMVGAQGPWIQLWANTTAQWPMTCYAAPIVGDDGVEKELVHNFIGCADSVLRDKGDGTLERVFHVEGRWWNRAMRYDWRFTNYMWRLFFCNPGFRSFNLRFDGVQTHCMGLSWPARWDEVVDEAGNYIPPGANDPDPTGLKEGCEIVGEQPLGQMVDCTGIDVDPNEPTPEGVVCWDVEYYFVLKRVLRTFGRSYVVRSRPRLLTETHRVCGDDDTSPVCRMRFELCPDPQVTHVEIYRNQRDSGTYFLVHEIALDQSVARMCDPDHPDYFAGPCDRLAIEFEDTIPIEDDDLLLEAEFETGRPPAAINLFFHRGRVWFVQQEARELIAFTNVTSPSGAINPEGFDPNHVIDPPMKGASAILALSPYHSILLAHGDNGMVGVTGLSDETNSANKLQASALAADAGAIGPDAWVNVDNVQYLMTRKGPAVLTGDELVYLSYNVEGSLRKAILRAEVGYASRCVYYRSRGRSQVWFTFTQDPFGEMNSAWVFDEEVQGPETRGQSWKVFAQMPVHGLCASEDGDGVEFPLLGGCRGRLYRHDRGATDAGLFIEFEVHTKPFDEGEYGRSIQPRWAYWHTRGDHGDAFFVDVRKDYEARNVNTADIRLRLGGGAGVYWNAGMWDPTSRLKWGDFETRPYVEQRMSMGQVFRKVQFVLSQSVARWPPGHKRAATFECAGYDFFFRLLGPRPAVAAR
jgi:hypothetical protein